MLTDETMVNRTLPEGIAHSQTTPAKRFAKESSLGIWLQKEDIEICEAVQKDSARVRTDRGRFV